MRKEIRLTTFLSTQFSVIIGLIKQSGGPNPGAQGQTHDQAVVVVIWSSQPESNLFICIFNPRYSFQREMDTLERSVC